MAVIEIDPADTARLAAWLEVRNAIALQDWPDDPPTTLDEARGSASGFGVSRTMLLAVVGPDNEIEGTAFLSMPLKDNLWKAELEDLQITAARRRSGLGRALVAHAEEIAQKFGRTATSTDKILEDAQADTPSHAFAAAMGYQAALQEYCRELALPTEMAKLGALAAAAIPFATDYEIVTFEGRCPDELVEGRLQLARGMSTDAPHGDLEHEATVWDEERLRSVEAKTAAMGNRSFNAGAVHQPSGLLVAITVIGVNRDVPYFGRQWLTIVSPEHRGHRLGILVKVANIGRLIENAPAVKRIQTWNAASNAPMAQVNEDLGFEVTALGTQWQRRLEPS